MLQVCARRKLSIGTVRASVGRGPSEIAFTEMRVDGYDGDGGDDDDGTGCISETLPFFSFFFFFLQLLSSAASSPRYTRRRKPPLPRGGVLNAISVVFMTVRNIRETLFFVPIVITRRGKINADDRLVNR